MYYGRYFSLEREFNIHDFTCTLLNAFRSVSRFNYNKRSNTWMVISRWRTELQYSVPHIRRFSMDVHNFNSKFKSGDWFVLRKYI